MLFGVGFEEEFRELSGGELKADFGKLSGFVSAKVVGKIILTDAFLEGAFVFDAPFFVAAAGFPVGDVSRGNADTVFIESSDDLRIGNVILEHEVDHVAKGLGEASDFAVATDFAGGRCWMVGS